MLSTKTFSAVRNSRILHRVRLVDNIIPIRVISILICLMFFFNLSSSDSYWCSPCLSCFVSSFEVSLELWCVGNLSLNHMLQPHLGLEKLASSASKAYILHYFCYKNTHFTMKLSWIWITECFHSSFSFCYQIWHSQFIFRCGSQSVRFTFQHHHYDIISDIIIIISDF